jgi:hypothetical protein
MLTITVEINPPHEGEDRRLAGLFARDDKRELYIAHTGRVGGGRAGIGQKAFRNFIAGEQWQEIATPGGNRIALVFGPVNSASFFDQLASFVGSVSRFKDVVRRGSR